MRDQQEVETVLVTGGSGFIGRHLLRALFQAGKNVVLLARPKSDLSADVFQRANVVMCNDWTKQGLATALKKQDFDHIFHLASYGACARSARYICNAGDKHGVTNAFGFSCRRA